MLEAAITNLIDNSRHTAASTLTISVHTISTGAVLTITDDGPGILTADGPRVFEPFFTGRRTVGGTGLGSAITRSLLSSYQATIDLVDRAGEAMFILVLPSRIG